MAGVDDLFSGEPPAPAPVERHPTLTRWLVAAAVLDVIGPCTFLSVPGAAVTLWAWTLADEELHRVEDAQLGPEVVQRARRDRRIAFGLLALTSLSLLLQVVVISAFVVGTMEDGPPPAP